jgi:hypothetical protein
MIQRVSIHDEADTQESMPLFGHLRPPWLQDDPVSDNARMKLIHAFR